MSFIAYATGSELVYSRYKKLLKKMAIITVMITLSVYFVCSVVLQFLLGSETARDSLGLNLAGCKADGSATMTLLGEQAEQCRVMEALSTDSSLRWAIALLIGAILTSRSPASAISIVGEMRADGDFTKTALGVTIFMYLGVILVFSITQAVSVLLVGSIKPAPFLSANASVVGNNVSATDLVEDDEGSAANVGLIIASVITSLLLSIVLGLLLGVVLYAIIGLPIRPALKEVARLRSPLHEVYIKASASLLLGMAIFIMRLALKELSDVAERDGVTTFKFRVEPLFSCLIGGIVVVNIRKGARAEEWKRMCKTIAPYVYCTFFTLAGGSVKFDPNVLRAAVVLVLVRLVGVCVGSMLGGVMAREERRHYRIGWMNYITQAGVALGFAQEIKEEYRQTFSASVGDPQLEAGVYAYMSMMADLVVVVVFINQIIGPPFFKFALRLSGEAYIDRIGGAQLLTIEGQAPQIQMKKVAWEVRAGARGSRVAQIVPGNTQTKLSREVARAQLEPLAGEAGRAAAGFPFISMLEDDTSNYEACKLVQSLYGARRCIVQQIDPAWKAKLNEIGGLVVDPTSLVMDSLDSFLGSPQSANMLLHNDPLAEVVRVHIDMDTAGQVVQYLKLPQCVQVLEVCRNGCDLAPRPFTTLRYGDELTLVGKPASLAQVTAIKKGRVVLVLDGGTSSFKRASIRAADLRHLSRSSYKFPDQTSVVREVGSFT